MEFQSMIDRLNDNRYLISMTSTEGLLSIGMEVGMKPGDRVLDLCCGYGEMLRIWSGAFGISGIGVDRCAEFIRDGRKRLKGERVKLIEADMLNWQTDEKFDFVSLSGEDFGGV